jgi:hypothetical protein
MYAESIHTILHDFRRPIESSTIEIEIAKGNFCNSELK